MKEKDLILLTAVCSAFFNVDVNAVSIKKQSIKKFDSEMLYSLESNKLAGRYLEYKLDYILPIGNDVYFIGEQFKKETVQTEVPVTKVTVTTWQYTYMDVIVSKLNSSGEFEWIKNAPLRNWIELKSPHVFKQYIAVPTENNIYIMYNEHPKNLAIYQKPKYEPKDLKDIKTIHGTNFVFSAIATGNGQITRGVIFPNEDYCFAPIQERDEKFFPPEKTEIFVPGADNTIFIYTEDKGKDQFSSLKLK
ncbi:MAG: hypothetical protein IPO21_04875 [Bacteroidales bacterium]|nr:hypothetical protein [Bacteroidales bacterium]